MGNLHCSIVLRRTGTERMENLDLEKIDFAALGPVVDRFTEHLPGMPLAAQCVRCEASAAPISKSCTINISIRWVLAMWGVSAIDTGSAMLSDGSVPLDTVNKVIRKRKRSPGNMQIPGVSIGCPWAWQRAWRE